MMNWIYVDKDTYEVKFGTRAWAEPNLTGPFDCTRQDRRLTFAGWEGFCLVKEGDFWALYFDLDDDMLKSKISRGTPVLEIELTRKEMRVRRPPRKEPYDDEKKNNGDGEKIIEAQTSHTGDTATVKQDINTDKASATCVSVEGESSTPLLANVSLDQSEIGPETSKPDVLCPTYSTESTQIFMEKQQKKSNNYRAPSVEDVPDEETISPLVMPLCGLGELDPSEQAPNCLSMGKDADDSYCTTQIDNRKPSVEYASDEDGKVSRTSTCYQWNERKRNERWPSADDLECLDVD